MRIAFLVAICAIVVNSAAFADCTTMIVTKGASADGSVFVTHSDDNDLMDQSIVHVPAREWPEGAMRPVYASAAALAPIPELRTFFTPRIVDADRAPGYAHPGEPATIPIGYIPQAAKTYAYLDGSYGIINEKGLMFGECTDGTHFTCDPEAGKRIFYASELSRIALERCATAREAIVLMGELIEKYGLYGTGETLPLADANEAWVFEMAPSPEGTGGLWVAQKVPDGHFFIAANEFRIRDVSRENTDAQLHSPRLFEILEAAGTLVPGKEEGTLDWLASVSEGEYNHPYYSLRRVWRGLSMVAPSLGLRPWISRPADKGLTRDYPFSIAPDQPLGLDDLKRIHRDHYEGTEFDLTRGIAAGPFGNPNRFLGPTDPSGDVGDDQERVGAWERPIGMFYTGFTFISQLRPELPAPANAVSWIALNSPAESVFVPLAVGPTPRGFDKGDTRTYDPESAWRVCNLVAEYANTRYCYIIKDIAARAGKHEQNAAEHLERFWAEMSTKGWSDPAGTHDRLHRELVTNAEAVITDWRALFTDLVVKYNQGFIYAGGGIPHKAGYPKEWLDMSGYAEGPIDYARRRQADGYDLNQRDP